jgi:uncharacterized cupredoxin-like copper-binding protein
MLRSAFAGLVAVAALVVAVGCGRDDGIQTVRIHFSQFEPGMIAARVGEPVTIRLANNDPIEHEWIVGDEAVHEMHRTGTHAAHDQIPTEVTVPPFSEKLTTVVFHAPGEFKFICHLPGHEAYGMAGLVRVQ